MPGRAHIAASLLCLRTDRFRPLRGFLTLSAVLLTCAACSGLRLPAPPQHRPGDWSTFGRSADRNAIASSALTPPLVVAWSSGFAAGAGRGSPVVIDSTVFLGTLKGELYAFRLRDGYQIGKVSLGQAIDGSPVVAGGNAIVAAAYSPRSLVRFDLMEGVKVWEATCGDLEATPLLVGDRIFVGSTAGIFTCVDFRTGTILWSYTLPNNDRMKGIRSAAAALDTTVIFGAEDGRVYALGISSGELVWTYNAGAVVHAPPVIADTLAVIGTLGGSLSAISGRTGRPLWSRTVDGGIAGPAVVSHGSVIVTTLRGCIAAFDRRSGTPLWNATPGTPMNSGAVVSGDILYAGTLTKELLAVNMGNGEIVWRTRLEGRVKSGLAIAGNRLLVATDDQTLVALEMPRSPQ